jgi:hypothetical protein
MIGLGRSGAPTQIVFDESDESGLNFLRNNGPGTLSRSKQDCLYSFKRNRFR